MDAFSQSISTRWRFRTFKISTHSTPLIRQNLSLTRPSSLLESLSGSFCHEFVCTISSGSSHAVVVMQVRFGVVGPSLWFSSRH